MKVLVLFATVEGQTGKIARFVAQKAGDLGHDAQLVDVDQSAPVPLADFGAAILAAPVHQRRHPKSFEAFLAAHRAELNACRTLLLSVSMSAAFPEGLAEANDYVIEMKMRTGFEPKEESLVAGAIRTSQYDYFAMQVLRHVVMRNRDYDASVGEHELTDWDALTAKVTEFLAAE